MTQPAPSLEIRPVRRVAGTLAVPGDKSISHRYVMLGAIARGGTRIANLAPGADVASTMACFRLMGARIDVVGHRTVQIDGRGWDGLSAPAAPLDAGNSGTTLRLTAGLIAGRAFHATLDGDASLRRRPMARIIAPLEAMGARIRSDNGLPPLAIDGGRLRGIRWKPPVPSAQVKSAIMLAALSATGDTAIEEDLPTRDHSERAFPLFGLSVAVESSTVRVPGGQQASAPSMTLEVPGDPSSAAVWAAAAAALPGSAIEITGVLLNPRRLGFINALRKMGARVTMEMTSDDTGEPVGTLRVAHEAHGACTIAAADVPDLIDELPVLAARAALGGSLEVTGASELRVKESDRISALVTGLRALGVRADERPDGFVVDGSRQPAGGLADACGDHRLVMAFALVGLGASGPTHVGGGDAVAVSYPDFARDLAALTT